MTEICPECSNVFTPNSRRVQIYCSNKCQIKSNKRSTTPEQARKYHLKSHRGITVEEYDAMFVRQNGKCAICGRDQSEFKKPLFVDHSHESQKIRGLLCVNCNNGLGLLKDDINILMSALEYLKKHLSNCQIPNVQDTQPSQIITKETK